jgi:hypothetical protein
VALHYVQLHEFFRAQNLLPLRWKPMTHKELMELADAYAADQYARAALSDALLKVVQDAERYRWLAVNAYVGIAPHPKPHEVWCLRLPNPRDCANLDAAIDAAMKEKP